VYDGFLRPGQPVDERALTYVGVADNGDLAHNVQYARA
jgi:hypothetical protein